MTLDQYLQSLRGKRVALLGLGVSHLPLAERLCRAGVSVLICDGKERAALGEDAARLERLGAQVRTGRDYLQDLDADVIFRTPGMRPDLPPLLRARANGSEITSEMSVFFRLCPCPILGVSGSDGKTTTTSVIAEMLRRSGKRVHLGGNIGHPLLCDLPQISAEDYAVVELSSFQLLDMTASPHIALLTNLAPNHLDVHRDMAEYVAAKKNLFLHQRAGDIAAFNADNEITAALSEQALVPPRLFSRQREVECGAFLRERSIVLRGAQGERSVFTLDDIRLPGWHNVENYLAAAAALDGLADDAAIRETARDFAGVAHRIELIRTRRGVHWYNDSIASSPTRTIAGLRAFPEKVILIAGGYDKKIPFDALGEEIVARVKTLILCGATADAIAAAVSAAAGKTGCTPEVLRCESLADCVSTAESIAQSGDVVTLSPACAAFDQFRNFMERGDVFRAMVNALPQ